MNYRYKELFTRIREIQSGPVRRKTFMDISGYPHYENVVSNILKFFLDYIAVYGL